MQGSKECALFDGILDVVGDELGLLVLVPSVHNSVSEPDEVGKGLGFHGDDIGDCIVASLN